MERASHCCAPASTLLTVRSSSAVMPSSGVMVIAVTSSADGDIAGWRAANACGCCPGGADRCKRRRLITGAPSRRASPRSGEAEEGESEGV